MLNERKLTERELDQRKSTLKGLLSNKRALVQKYGKDAEKVMYGVATKQAKNKVESMDKEKIKEYIKQALLKKEGFVDTAPVMEKPLAQKAGLGWQGKHTNLVSKKAGNWFFLGFILDFIEITFIVIPLIGPALFTLGFDPLWIGILIALVLQTSFITPPFGFSLFYLRGVLPRNVKTIEIYKGIIPFLLIQILLVIVVFIFPDLATALPEILL